MKDLGAEQCRLVSPMKRPRRGGSTLRRFSIEASRFEAYCKALPDYAREAKAPRAENLKASNLRKGAAKRALHIASTVTRAKR
jgi:hypothetical protein